jgi:hypothetical protein
MDRRRCVRDEKGLCYWRGITKSRRWADTSMRDYFSPLILRFLFSNSIVCEIQMSMFSVRSAPVSNYTVPSNLHEHVSVTSTRGC